MMKDVVISINSTFSFEEGEEQQMEFTTDGYYFYEDEVGCLSYEETEVTGLEGTRTSLFVMPDQVVVDREGTVTSRMVFREGLKSAFQYATPFGNATMGIDTRRISQSMGATAAAWRSTMWWIWSTWWPPATSSRSPCRKSARSKRDKPRSRGKPPLVFFFFSKNLLTKLYYCVIVLIV